MSIEHVSGHASTVMWDQGHADALHALRTSRAFVLITLPKDSDRPAFRAQSCDLTPEGFIDLLMAARDVTADTAMELVNQCFPDAP